MSYEWWWWDCAMDLTINSDKDQQTNVSVGRRLSHEFIKRKYRRLKGGPNFGYQIAFSPRRRRRIDLATHKNVQINFELSSGSCQTRKTKTEYFNLIYFHFTHRCDIHFEFQLECILVSWAFFLYFFLRLCILLINGSCSFRSEAKTALSSRCTSHRSTITITIAITRRVNKNREPRNQSFKLICW